MRNLKRALSLTLASVMLLGMMVLGTSAAVAYPDVTDEHNVEAIEVLQAVGVMSGSNSGNFNPDSKVTRVEMAIVMANLLDLNPDYFQGQNQFSDVPAWASGYVNACAANGIVTGVGDGRFGTGNVTATQAALMMLKALGYFQYNSDFNGDWARATANQAAKIRLFEGLNVQNNTQLTRNQVAQLALNAIESGMVDADNSGTINVVTPDGTTVTNGSVNYVYRSSQQSFAKAIDTTEKNFNTSALTGVTGSVIELGEQLYNGDLKRYEDTDNFGAPSTRWTYKNSEIGNYADEADYKFEGEVKSNAMYSAVGKTVAENYLWVVKMDGREEDAEGNDLFVRKDVADNDKDTLAGTKRGAVTYVYLNDDEVKVSGTTYSGTATVCIVNTYAAEITKVSGDTITLDDMDDAGLTYDIAGYAEEDVVLYTKSIASNGDWTVESVLGKADLVEGKADTIREANRVVIGDKTYFYSYRFFDGESKKLDVDSVDENVAFYLDQQGNIIMLADAAESNDYAYVYSIGNASSKYGDDAEYGAKLILTDGTTKNVDIDKDDTDAWTKLSGVSNGLNALKYGATKSESTWTAASEGSPVSVTETDANKKVPLLGQIVSYTEDGGVYSLEIKTTDSATWTGKSGNELKDVLKNGNSRVNMSNAATKVNSYAYTDRNSAILLNPEYETSADKYESYVGYENAPSVDVVAGSKLVAYVKDGVVKAMYISDAVVKGNNKVVFVIGGAPKENGTGSNKYYIYDAVVDGEIQSIRVKSGSEAKTTLDKIGKGNLGVFFGITENSSGYVTRLTTALPSDIEVNGTTSNTDNKWAPYVGVSRETSDGLMGFKWNDTKKEYEVRPAANKDATVVYYDGSDLTAESLHTDRNDEAYVVTDDGEVIAVFVWEKKDGESGTPITPPDEDPAYGLTLKGETLTFTYTVGDTSGIRKAIRDLLEGKDYTDVVVAVDNTGHITGVTAKENGDEISFILKMNEIVVPGSDDELTEDLDEFKGFTSYPSQSFDPETKTISMSGQVKPLVKVTDEGEAKNKQEAALKAFANEDNKAFDTFEALYDLKNGTWGFVTVTVDGENWILLVGKQKDEPTHAWPEYEREDRIKADAGEMGIVLRSGSGETNGKVVFLEQWTTPSGIKINVKDLTLPTA